MVLKYILKFHFSQTMETRCHLENNRITIKRTVNEEENCLKQTDSGVGETTEKDNKSQKIATSYKI